MGLLVASGAGAPAALATDDDATTGRAVTEPREDAVVVTPAEALESWQRSEIGSEDLVADFGVGKALLGDHPLTVALAPQGAVPADLDRSGAVLAFRDVAADDDADDLAAWCVTDVDGSCAVEQSGDEDAENGTSLVALDAGTYVIEQVSGVEGLAPAQGVLGTFEMGSCFPSGEDMSCLFGTSFPVANDSLFSTAVVTTVVDETTLAPLAGAGYLLTGPDYRHRYDVENAGDCQDDGDVELQVPVEVPADGPVEGRLEGELPIDVEGPGGVDGSATTPLPDEAGDGGQEVGESEAGDTGIGRPEDGEPAIGGTEGEPETGDTEIGEPETNPDVAAIGAEAPPAFQGPGDTDPESLDLATSDGSGVLTHIGCLLPGTWTLEPVSTPAGYQPRSVDVELAPVPAGAEPASRVREVTVELRPVADPGGPTTPPTTPPSAPVATAPAPPAASPGVGPGPGTTGTGAVVGGTAAGSSAAPSSAAPTVAAVPPAPTGAPRPTTARPSAVAAPADQPAPELEARSSSDRLQVGLVGFGIVAVGVLFLLVLVVRRRARERRG